MPVCTPYLLRRWRRQRRWAVWRAAMWAGITGRSWQNYESGSSPIPKWLRLRLNELRYQERTLACVRERLVALTPSLTTRAQREAVDALLPLLESATPDSENLRMRRSR